MVITKWYQPPLYLRNTAIAKGVILDSILAVNCLSTFHEKKETMNLLFRSNSKSSYPGH